MYMIVYDIINRISPGSHSNDENNLISKVVVQCVFKILMLTF